MQLQTESANDMKTTLASFLLGQELEDMLTVAEETLRVFENMLEWRKSGDLQILQEIFEWLSLIDDWTTRWKDSTYRLRRQNKLGEVKITPSILIQTSILLNEFTQGKRQTQEFSKELLSCWDSSLHISPSQGRPFSLASFFCYFYILYPLMLSFDPNPYKKLLTAALVIELIHYPSLSSKKRNFKECVKRARTMADRVWILGTNTNFTPVVQSKWWQPVENLIDNLRNKRISTPSDFEEICLEDYLIGDLDAHYIIENLNTRANQSHPPLYLNTADHIG